MQPGKPPKKLRALFRRKQTDGDTGAAPAPKSNAKPLALGKILRITAVLGGTFLLLAVVLAVLTLTNRRTRTTIPPPYAVPAPSTAVPVVVTPENTQPPTASSDPNPAQATPTPPLAVAPGPAATQTPEESSKPVPAPARKRNPFGNPEALTQDAAQKEGISTPPPSPPGLNPLPPAPTPALPVPPPAPMPTEPAMPDVRCLAVLEGNMPSAVVLYRGTEMVIENGGSIPALGKLIRVQDQGCEFAIGKRRLVVTLSGERKWK